MLEMPEIPLKHYKTYIKLLVLYAHAVGIRIEVRDDLGVPAIWVPNGKKIYVDDQLSESSEVASILHELGHSLDDAIYSNPNAVIDSYSQVYKAKYNKKHDKVVIACERRAWKYGRILAKQLGIRLGKWYDQAEKSCLASYKES